ALTARSRAPAGSGKEAAAAGPSVGRAAQAARSRGLARQALKALRRAWSQAVRWLVVVPGCAAAAEAVADAAHGRIPTRRLAAAWFLYRRARPGSPACFAWASPTTISPRSFR